MMQLTFDGLDIFWDYKGKKLNIKTDTIEIHKMWREYWNDKYPVPLVIKKWTGPKEIK